jgi:hypothetical protein
MRAILLTLALASTCAVAGDGAAQPGQPRAPGPNDAISAENLVAPVPTGWKIASNRTNRQGFTLIEYIPASETFDNWTNMVTVAIYRGAGGVPVSRFFDAQEKIYRDGCETPPIIGKRQEITENGYPGGAELLACRKTKQWGKAEAMIYKTLIGKDAAYQVQRAWRLPPSSDSGTAQIDGLNKQMLDEGNSYLGQVYVCDTRDPSRSRPCPNVRR